MLRLTSYKLAKKGVTYSHSSVMARLPQYFADKIIQWGRDNIAVADICNEGDAHGRENDMHVTVKYGLHTENADEVKELIQGFGHFDIKCVEVSRFTKNDAFDVVKISVAGDRLHELHRIIGTLKNSDEHPAYKPHITIAYINKGCCAQLSGMKPFDGQKITVRQLIFSSKNNETTGIRL